MIGGRETMKTKFSIPVIVMMVIVLIGVAAVIGFEWKQEQRRADAARYNDMIEMFVEVQDRKTGPLSIDNESDWDAAMQKIESCCMKTEIFDEESENDVSLVKEFLIHLSQMSWEDPNREGVVEGIGELSYAWKKIGDSGYFYIHIEDNEKLANLKKKIGE